MKSADNAFYVLLVIVGTAFAVTALAYSLPQEMLPGWFWEHGWKLLLGLLGCLILCGLLSMGHDSATTPTPPVAEESPDPPVS